MSVGLGVTNAIVMTGNPLSFNLTNDLLLSGPISGGSNFVKSGGATLILSGSNTFTGNLTNSTISLGGVVRHTGVSIDNMAHLGGFSCGLLFAAPLVPRIGSPRNLFLFRLRVATVMVVGILVLFGFYLAQLPR